MIERLMSGVSECNWEGAYTEAMQVGEIELGHALGLQHVPVSGNVMSYNYMPAMYDKWLAPAEFLELALFMTGEAEALEFLTFPDILPGVLTLADENELYLRSVYTRSVTRGEQDKMALMCIYDFADWNH